MIRVPLVLALGVFAFGACAATGPHAWRRSDVALEASFLGALSVDWMQSGKYVDGCREANPAIGACGDRIPLAAYIPIAAAMYVAITHVLPRGTWRTAWLGFTAGLELDTIYANHLLDTGH